MIEIKYHKGKVTEAHVEGTGAELVAEMACIINVICQHLAEIESDKEEKTITYAYFMALTSHSIVELLEHNGDVEELVKKYNKRR